MPPFSTVSDILKVTGGLLRESSSSVLPGSCFLDNTTRNRRRREGLGSMRFGVRFSELWRREATWPRNFI
jgi:hypothetical protein